MTSIYLTDLSQCLPAGGLSRDQVPYRWHVVDYEADGLAGTMLMAGPETQAPEVRLTLNAAGWHAIYLGVWGDPWSTGGTAIETGRRRLIQVKLTADASFTLVERDEPASYPARPSGPEENQYLGDPHLALGGMGKPVQRLEMSDQRYQGEEYHYLSECFWKCADLTGQHLIIGQPYSPYAHKRMGALAYVRLQPLSEAETQNLWAERQDPDTKRLIAICDGTNFLWQQGPTSRKEIWREIEPLRDSDFWAICWQGGLGDSRNYPTQVSRVMGTDVRDFGYSDRYAAEALQILLGRGINPLKTALDYAHQLGLQFFVGERMGAVGCYPPFEATYTGPLYCSHPEWRCVDRDGRPIARMSYAYAGVQDYMLALFRETTSYGADGVHLIFVRGAPFVLYEQPALDDFQVACGLDARSLPEGDERWLRYRSRYMTGFMTRLRRQLDELGATMGGKRLAIVASVYGRPADNDFFGLDLAGWIQQGLVDILSPYPWKDGHSADTLQDVDVDYFTQLTRGTSCKLYVEMLYRGGGRRMPPEAWRQRARALYDAGVDGLSIWDVDHRHTAKAQWSTISRLGHLAELRNPELDQRRDFRFVKLKSIGGYTVDRYPPDWGY
jgi:hypothetical protein